MNDEQKKTINDSNKKPGEVKKEDKKDNPPTNPNAPRPKPSEPSNRQ